MSLLSPRLQLKVAQKQILTPGLVQMVTLLQLNRLELREMVNQELASNPVLEESADGGEELTPEEVQAVLEADRERLAEHPDQTILEATGSELAETRGEESLAEAAEPGEDRGEAVEAAPVESLEQPAQTEDVFDQIDFGSFFDDYLDPGFRSPAAEPTDKPSFETFLSSPVTLADYLQSQLSLMIIPENVRDAATAIIGNLDESGYLRTPLEEIVTGEELDLESVIQGLKAVQSLDPAGIGARDLRECLLLQLESRNGLGGVAWQIVNEHLKLLEAKRQRDLAKILGRPKEHIEIALGVIQHLNPAPGLRYSTPPAQKVEPDVYISKDGDDYLIQLNDEDIPQLRLNPQYRRMLDRDQEPDKEIRNYVKERFASAVQLIKNIEQRKQTIAKVCQSIVQRQREFLDRGIDQLRPMMIKDVAEEIGVHPSTVSRAVASKYAHTPQGVFELRYFFSEAVQGPSGSGTPLLILKRKVKKMIEEEDPRHPLTDEHITARLHAEGYRVTRRTVAKYREDMKIASTHQRRVRD
jgi:RNA polymerase sigma-54 factor